MEFCDNSVGIQRKDGWNSVRIQMEFCDNSVGIQINVSWNSVRIPMESREKSVVSVEFWENLTCESIGRGH